MSDVKYENGPAKLTDAYKAGKRVTSLEELCTPYWDAFTNAHRARKNAPRYIDYARLSSKKEVIEEVIEVIEVVEEK